MSVYHDTNVKMGYYINREKKGGEKEERKEKERRK